MDLVSQTIAEWRDFYAAVASVGATLVGLVYVGISGIFLPPVFAFVMIANWLRQRLGSAAQPIWQALLHRLQDPADAAELTMTSARGVVRWAVGHPEPTSTGLPGT